MAFCEEIMPLIRSDSQGGGDVKAHYISDEKYSDDVTMWHNAMCDLIDALDAALPNTKVWGLTSHDRLGLMSVSEYDQGEAHVGISRFFDGVFYMSYWPPEGTLPIPRSYVDFTASGVEEAVSRIKVAMKESGAWPDSPDLG